MATMDDLLAALHAQTSLLGAIETLAQPAAQRAVPGVVGSAGPSAVAPRPKGLIKNGLALPWLSIENRSALPLGLGFADPSGAPTPEPVSLYTVPPLHVRCVAIRPDMAVVWQLNAPGPAGWSAAKRSLPYVLHADGAPMLEPLYPQANAFDSIRTAAIDAGQSLIVGVPADWKLPKDAALVSCTVAFDSIGAGAVGDLVSIEGCYDLASDGVTPAGPWGSIFPWAGSSASTGVLASLQIPGATGVQITNHNAVPGQTVTCYVNLFYGIPG